MTMTEPLPTKISELKLGEIIELLSSLNNGSKADGVTNIAVLSEYPLIVRTPNCCGGDARFIRTRIPVWSIERARQLGTTEEDILVNYPTLTAGDLVQGFAYVESHREEIEEAIIENEEA